MEGSDVKSEESQGQELRSEQEQDQSYIAYQQQQASKAQILQKQPQPKEELAQRIHKTFQFIYIAAYSQVYRQKLEEIVYKYGCDLSFVRSSYIVYCKDSSKSQAWNTCKEAVKRQADKIIYQKLQERDKKLKMYNSPQINRIANSQGIYFCPFNDQIYIHTNQLSQVQLKQKKKQLYRYCNIFTVCFVRKRTLEPIDLQIIKYYRTVLNGYFKQRFEKNNLIVELNRAQRSVYILGKPGAAQYQMMQAKKTVKGMIQGLTCVSFKNNSLSIKQQSKLRQYLKGISMFPIISGKLSQNVTIILSKDNILRQLLKKSESIKKKVGIIQTTQIGIYIPQCFSMDQKKQQINKICKQQGYDYWSTWCIKYFRPMIASDNQIKDPMEIVELIIKIIAGFIEVKEKHEFMKEKKQPEQKLDALKKKQLQQQSRYAYFLKNSTKDYKELAQILRRDVIEDQVMMKKRYNVIYSSMEGKEIGPFYIDKDMYDKGVIKGQITLIEQKDLKKGDYFQTYFKLENESLSNKDIQSLFIHELKRLKQAAKTAKPDDRSYCNQAKLAHMIKKMIKIF